ncbi:MAG: hypothetical protein JXP34_05880 [Planctomycetes bacterium]|nr:hypothetical protein [Planctomycetota bacterium]
MIRAARTIAILLSAPLLLLGGGEGLVLCLGDGGHIALEISSGSCCAGDVFGPRPGGEPSPQVLRGPVAEGSCDGCVDVPLSVRADHRERGAKKDVAPTWRIAPAGGAYAQAGPFTASPAAAPAPPPPDPLLASLRATVLLL